MAAAKSARRTAAAVAAPGAAVAARAERAQSVALFLTGAVLALAVSWLLGSVQPAQAPASADPARTEPMQVPSPVEPPSPAPAEGLPRFSVLSWDSRLFYAPKFLSDEDVEYMLRRGAELLEQEHGPQWQSRQRLVVYFGGEWRRDPVVKRIEQRLARMTMIPEHDEELDLMLTYHNHIKSELSNVHHDLNGAENRIVTAVVYLNDVQAGGHTIFPCLGDDKANVDATEAFSRAFHQESRRVLFPKPHWNDTLMHQCNQMCAGRLPAARIQPRRGAAAIFWSRFPDGAPDPRMWHAACPVYKGAKWTLQKFKEIPRLHGEWALDDWSAEDGSPRQPRWEEAPQKPNSIMP